MLQTQGSDSPADRASNELILAHFICHDSTCGSAFSVFLMTSKPNLSTDSMVRSTIQLGVARSVGENDHQYTCSGPIDRHPTFIRDLCFPRSISSEVQTEGG